MTTVNLQVSASTDDALELNTGWVATGGYVALDASDEWGGFRFTNVTIPQGATIDSASLQISVLASADDIEVDIYGHDTDSAGTFVGGAGADISSRDRTSASVNESATGVGAGWHTMPDVKTIIQEIVNRGGWSSGNDLALILDGLTGCDATIETYDTVEANAAKLDIEYTLSVNVSDSATVSESVTVTFAAFPTLSASVSDSNIVTESVKLNLIPLIGVSDSSNLTENVTISLLSISVSESVSVADPVALWRLGTNILVRSITQSSDDAQESNAPSVPDLTSTYLTCDWKDNYVGLRFQNITIPQGANIDSAYLRLVARNTAEDCHDAEIYPEDVDDAATFTSGSGNISDRQNPWGFYWWTVSDVDAGAPKDTPDFASLLQTTVTRPGWSSGNAVAIILRSNCQYDAAAEFWSYDHGSNEPQLFVHYTPVFSIGVGDFTSISESIGCSISTLTVNTSDSVSISEWAGIDYDFKIEEPISLAESVSTTISTLTISISDSVSITEYVKCDLPVTYPYYLVASDSISVSESVSLEIGGEGSIIFDPPVAASSDDAREDAGGTLTWTDDNLPCGDWSGTTWHSAYRFLDITIPMGATITTAYVIETARDNDRGAFTYRWYAEDAASPVTFSAVNPKISERTKTTTSVAGAPDTWVSGLQYTSVELKTIIQELVDTYNYSAGAPILIIKWYVSGNRERVARSYDHTPADAPFLYIEYTGGVVALLPQTSDSIGTTENVAASLPNALALSVSDSIATSESVTASLSDLALAVSDAIALSESVDSLLLALASVSDSVSVGETVSLTVSGPQVSASDSATLTENVDVSIITVGVLSLSVSDTIGVTEAVALNISTLTISKSESITTAESVSLAISTSGIDVSDSSAVSESVQVSTTRQLSISDSASVAESVSVSVQAIGVLSLSVSDTIAVTESVALVISTLTISVSESSTISENVNASLPEAALSLSVSDAISVVDIAHYYPDLIAVTERISVSFIVVFEIDVSETVSVSESISAALSISLISVSDAVSLSENIDVTTLIPGLPVSASDSAALSEQVDVLLSTLTLAISDSITISEQVVILILTRLTVSDDVTTVENIAAVLIASPAVSDTVTLTESVSAGGLLPAPQVSDAITVSESRLVSIPGVIHALSVSDAISVSQSINLIIGAVLVDLFAWTLYIDRARSFTQYVDQSVSFSQYIDQLRSYTRYVDQDESWEQFIDQMFSWEIEL